MHATSGEIRGKAIGIAVFLTAAAATPHSYAIITPRLALLRSGDVPPLRVTGTPRRVFFGAYNVISTVDDIGYTEEKRNI